VDRVLASPLGRTLLEGHPRGLAVDSVREVLKSLRAAPDDIPKGDESHLADFIATRAQDLTSRRDQPGLGPVLNATGVILHTNLGRAPLSRAASDAIQRVAQGYANLEFDLGSGSRGSRYVHCTGLLCELTGAEDALVVNNAAAALILALNTVARGGGVAVSRGELIEIGGGFRIPEIVERAETELVEVGTTNRTRIADFADLEPQRVRALLKVHRSNFRLQGFQEEVSVADLVSLGTERSIPTVHDLGSGLMVPLDVPGLPQEPTVGQSVDQGADLVVFSGDKLLGGPQAGLLVGRAEWIERARANPLCRALRVDALTLSALEATLRAYRDPDGARASIPTLRMIHLEASDLEERARHMAAALVAFESTGLQADVTPVGDVVGGGTLPGSELPGWALRIRWPQGSIESLAAQLRTGQPAVVGRLADGALLLHPRTLNPSEDARVVQAVGAAVASVAR